MAMRWAQEACDRYIDPESGSRVIQLTSSASMSNNVYCEQPYSSPDGRRVAIVRRHDTSDATCRLLIGELETLQVAQLAHDVVGSVTTTPWSGLLYYWTGDRCLQRLSLETLTIETLLHEDDPETPLGSWFVSPDGRYLIFGSLLPGPSAGVVRIDLHSGWRSILLDDPEVIKPHP